MTAGPEPGWYPDPDDATLARFWDGGTWTEHVHQLEPDPPTAATPPLAAPPPPAALPPTPAPAAQTPHRIPGIVMALAFVAMIVVGGAVLVLSALNPSGDTTAAATEVPPPPLPSPGDLPELEHTTPRPVDPAALEAAGCVEVHAGDGSDRSHIDLATAPPAEELYDVPLPAWGPHTPQVLPLLPEPATRPLDPRVLLHNLEHGAIAVWFDPATIDGRTVEELAVWQLELLHGGFRSDAGSNIYLSATPPGLDVAPVSLRAWGVAVDCPAWDPAAADAFVATHYGSRGQAPEASLGPYPDDGPLLGPAEGPDTRT